MKFIERAQILAPGEERDTVYAGGCPARKYLCREGPGVMIDTKLNTN